MYVTYFRLHRNVVRKKYVFTLQITLLLKIKLIQVYGFSMENANFDGLKIILFNNLLRQSLTIYSSILQVR